MFTINLKLTKRFITAVILVLMAVLLLIFIVVRNSAKTSRVAVQCDTEASVKEYIESFGYIIGELKTDEIIIPDVFNDVYNNYNNIQKSQGFDLSEYRGKTVVRYTYCVYNFSEKSDNVYAEVLVFDGTVIAADFYSTALDGFIIALK